MKVAVIGGGIAGLAAAWELRSDAEVTVFEPGPLGGKLQTSEFVDRPVDEGADAFLTRVPEALDLCAELGLTDELVAPAAGRTLLWTRGRLRQLPDGLALGVPRQIRPILTSGLLSPAGMVRAGLDLVLPRRELPDDVSVDELVAGRFGPQVASRLVEPLVGSIHAARTADLSAAAVAPQILAAARRSRSLLRGLRSMPGGPAGDAGPLFLAPRTGMGRLVERLVSRLRADGVTMVPRAVSALRAAPGGGIALDDDGHFDGAVLAVPAPIAARLLGSSAPAGLGDLSLTTVVLTTLAYSSADLPPPPGANGILVPPAEGALMTACSFGSSKWPAWAAPGTIVVRVSAGRHGDRRAAELDDGALVERLAGELGRMLGSTAQPAEARVSRWPDSFPLYRVGHIQRVDGFDAALAARLPGVALAGSSYRGAGIPACIGSGRRAARLVLVSGRRRASASPGTVPRPLPPEVSFPKSPKPTLGREPSARGSPGRPSTAGRARRSGVMVEAEASIPDGLCATMSSMSKGHDSWDRLIWWVDVPTFDTVPSNSLIAYAPGIKMSARPGRLAAVSAARVLGHPVVAARALRSVGSLKEVLRAAMWSRSAELFEVRHLVDADARPAWCEDLVLCGRRRARPPVVCSPDEARAGCVTVIITQDRAQQLRQAIESVLGVLSDHVLVVDGGSVDDSIEVARDAGAEVISRPFRNDFAAQRNFATEQARVRFEPLWIAVVDSDEIVTPELAELYLWIMCQAGGHDAVFGPLTTKAGDEQWNTIDYRPMLYRPTLRYVGAGDERLTAIRPLFIPLGGPIMLNIKSRAQFLQSRLLYAKLRPGVVPPDVLERSRVELADLTKDEPQEL